MIIIVTIYVLLMGHCCRFCLHVNLTVDVDSWSCELETGYLEMSIVVIAGDVGQRWRGNDGDKLDEMVRRVSGLVAWSRRKVTSTPASASEPEVIDNRVITCQSKVLKTEWRGLHFRW